MLALVRIFSASSFIISPVLSIKSCKPLSLFFHKGIVYMILFCYPYHALSVDSSYRICIKISRAMIKFIWQPGYPDHFFRGCMPFNSLTVIFHKVHNSMNISLTGTHFHDRYHVEPCFHHYCCTLANQYLVQAGKS